MKPIPKLLLALAFALSSGLRVPSQDIGRDHFQARVSSPVPPFFSIPVASEPSSLGILPTITHYATRFDGDHSLEGATVVEQAYADYTLYTVRLQFASGAEQAVVIMAPPGGLLPEMRDMSGDSIPNDLVLTSRLFGWPLIVLLNEGHDHLTVAISTGASTTGEGRASGPHQVYRASALVNSGFKRGGLTDGGGLHYTQLEGKLLSPLARVLTKHADGSSTSGRAPPAPAIQI